jgi:hypothetical protein
VKFPKFLISQKLEIIRAGQIPKPLISWCRADKPMDQGLAAMVELGRLAERFQGCVVGPHMVLIDLSWKAAEIFS